MNDNPCTDQGSDTVPMITIRIPLSEAVQLADELPLVKFSGTVVALTGDTQEDTMITRRINAILKDSGTWQKAPSASRRAFVKEMYNCYYGYDTLVKAWYFFNAGWYGASLLAAQHAGSQINQPLAPIPGVEL
jgi:hypothetical protein